LPENIFKSIRLSEWAIRPVQSAAMSSSPGNSIPAGLNPRQREAIAYLDGPLLVLAGAGSGKTRVITEKIVHLIETCDIKPHQVAAITFTNKAAMEMSERIAKRMASASKGTPKGLTIATFHSLGLRMVREEAKTLGYKPGFSIFDSADCLGIINELSGTTDKAKLRWLQTTISLWKNGLLSPKEAADAAKDEEEVVAARVYCEYANALHAYQAVDFDDLIRLPVTLLQDNAEIRQKWQDKFRHILVDEYQDTNTAQYRLLQQLTGVRASFTAVGDDDQAIYGWRGADVENLRRLTEDFPQLKVIKLEQNYRSTGKILDAANTLIENNPKLFPKSLWSEHGPGANINVIACAEGEAEAETVVMKLQGHRFEHRAKFSDYAILYRSNHQARVFEQALRQQRIPYLLSGGQSFFDKAEIKDLLAYLRLLVNDDDDPAFIRAATTPRRGIGTQTLATLGRYAAERQISLFAALFEEGFAAQASSRVVQPLREFGEFINRFQWRAQRESAADVFPDILAAIDYENWLYDQEESRAAETRWGNVQEFHAWITKKSDDDGKTLAEIVQTMALMSLLERRDQGDDYDAVQLSTLHAAKGLEFGHVFLVGVEENILPHRESQEAEKLEEERRLMYVGITRAQRSLHITWCEKRRQGKELVPCEPSRFIQEMGCEAATSASKTVADKSTSTAKLDFLKALLQKNNSGDATA
jgi:ATP-dependent DNA helicase Rep